MSDEVAMTDPVQAAEELMRRAREAPTSLLENRELAPRIESVTLALSSRGDHARVADLRAMHVRLLKESGRPNPLADTRPLRDAFVSHLLAQRLDDARRFLDEWLAAEPAGRERALAVEAAASYYSRSNRHDEAIELYQRAVRERESLSRPGRELAETLGRLAAALDAAGRAAEAEAARARAAALAAHPE